MSYSCPDCEDGTLEAKVREIELGDGESAQIVGGVVLITSVGCDNGCSSHVVETAAEEPKAALFAPVPLCQKQEGCTRSAGHRGMHSKPKTWPVEAAT